MRWTATTVRPSLLIVGMMLAMAGCGGSGSSGGSTITQPEPPDTLGRNPIIRACFSSDPAALVYDGRVWLHTGHDEATFDDNHFVMNDWQLYSSSDMVHWQEHGSPMSVETFAWAQGDAWASQAIERDGTFYYYAAVRAADGFGIGVGVADTPEGPFEDALGAPLIDNKMTTGPNDMDWYDAHRCGQPA